ncbi:MAG: uroporphyrinogen-III C-methyltransferase [Hyphomicrobium sp.]|nr:uroporphyrinogen-III C-methyltransferase [Hyphomicrobium sp.]
MPQSRTPQATRPSRMDALATLPVFFKLGGKRVVLAGASEPALWKAELLAAAGAHVDIYAAAFTGEFHHLAAHPPAGRVMLNARHWQVQDLCGAALAVGAITDDGEAADFAAAAKAAGVPVNVIDRPAFCQFQFGSIVNRSPLVVAISTDGAAPVFGQAIRSRLEALLPQGFKRWAEAAKDWRREGSRLGADMPARRRFWERFTERAMTEAGRAPTAEDLEQLIADAAGENEKANKTGFVSLVGAGPGDPELLTLRALRALRSADVVLYDDLVTPQVLDFARREAERMLVGKTGYGPACKQTEINALMVELARKGRRVVRLKSGDPMIFGRGGEEIDELVSAGIAFDVIPGISTAQAAASLLKVSLTHRDHAKRLQFVTGHSREGRLPENLDWRALADPGATTAVYMALRTLSELSGRLLEHGLNPETPAFALFDVGRAGETVIRSTILGLPGALAAAEVTGPCLVLIGEALRPALGPNTPITDGQT